MAVAVGVDIGTCSARGTRFATVFCFSRATEPVTCYILGWPFCGPGLQRRTDTTHAAWRVKVISRERFDLAPASLFIYDTAAVLSILITTEM